MPVTEPRRTAWHKACYEEYEALGIELYQPHDSLVEDQGGCCAGCGQSLEIMVRRKYVRRWQRLGKRDYPRWGSHWSEELIPWQDDHIIALVDALPHLDDPWWQWRLENRQALCIACHHLKTALEAVRRARWRRAWALAHSGQRCLRLLPSPEPGDTAMPQSVDGLKPAAYNPRTISKDKLKALARAMAEFGDLSGIVFNRQTGNLIGGHQRVKSLKKSWSIVSEPHSDKVGTVAVGYIETPWGRWSYREVDWPEAREKAANVAANQHGGEFEDEGLKALLAEVGGMDFDLSLTGFDLDELQELLGNAPEPLTPAPKKANPEREDDDDPAPAPPEPAQHQFLVQALLTGEEHRRWVRLKAGKTDKAYILELIADVA
ncbi:MAG: hypothetical protein V1797_06475 [Pseudomonadota bacterium]